MERSFGSTEAVLVVGVLALFGAISLGFTHVQRKTGARIPAGRSARAVFLGAAWVFSLGAILGWLLVLAELALGPVSPVNAWLLAVAFGLAAPPIGQMHRALAPEDEAAE